MTAKNKKETIGFRTEIQQLLKLMIHSLYTNREIFLRELISNASDAADKLRFEGLQDDSLFENDADLKIRVEFNKELKTISVIDNGIGMSHTEVIDNLGTIAKSGTKQFFERLTGDQTSDSQLIGQFGVGFYSSFIVAKKVEVVTRRAGLPRTEGVRWISTGESEYTVETLNRPKRGTKVVLYLHDDAEEFLDSYRLRSIISKYSDHISLPIVMPKEGDDKKGDETVNSATALWKRSKKDINEEEYNEFYKHVGHDFENPIAYVHAKIEGKLEYTSLLFIPSRAPFDLWDREHRRGVKLYVRRIFIMDDAEQLLPPYLRFVRGVVDSDDLPLNISREILQKNKTIDSIRSGCTKKVLDLLADMADKDKEKYQLFWKEFGKVIKEGIIEISDKKEDLAKLFRFASTRDSSGAQETSLDDYIAKMKRAQKDIYYITAENLSTAKNSPHLEIFYDNDIEVLLLTDPIDEWLTAHMTEYLGKPLKSVVQSDLDLTSLIEKKKGEKSNESNKKYDELIKRIKQVLDDRVKEVRITLRLTTSPACLVVEDQGLSRHMQQILRASGQHVPTAKPILEINPDHPLVMKLQNKADDEQFANWSNLLFDQALLSEGGKLSDPAVFVQRMNGIIIELSRENASAK